MEKKKNNDKLTIFITWLITGIFFQFMLCHMAALMNEGLGYTGAFIGFMDHMIASPFDIFYYNGLIYGCGWIFYSSILLVMITRPQKIRGEMDGIEHGSSRFQTPEDIKKFLEKFSTPILPYEEPYIVDELEEDVDIKEEEE